MTLAFIEFGFIEIIFIIIWIAIIYAVGNYGRDTALGYWGSILLAIFTTPLIAFIVILVLKKR